MSNLPAPPPKLEELPYGTILAAGLGHSMVIGDFDFETYSEAGYCWEPETQKFIGLEDAGKGRGISVVGALVYAQHPSCEVLSLAYDLKDGRGRRTWSPKFNKGLPEDLFRFLAEGKLLEAWNCSFERWIWQYVCVPKYGFPPLPFHQLRDAKAKALAFCLPPSLANAGAALGTPQQKDGMGKRLINKYSIPKNPTKREPNRRRVELDWADPDTLNLFMYNLQDIVAEASISSRVPDLSAIEAELWSYDQLINARGVQVDIPMVKACITIIKKAQQRYTQELRDLTDERVSSASKVTDLLKWLSSNRWALPDLREETVSQTLANPLLPPHVRRVLEIRSMLASASVKKVFALLHKTGRDGRLTDMFVYHGARTGRYTAQGVQPQNFPNSGPTVYKCTCDNPPRWSAIACASCKAPSKEWNADAVDSALATISEGNLKKLITRWGDPMKVVSGCLRGLFISKPGHDLICSDYSAIEAVVLAALAGEEWRLDVFRTHGMIYETSASKITGILFQEYVKHKKETGQHHPTRKTIGKVAELASGYQGGLGAWKQFGADQFFNDDQINANIKAWRTASPMIVKLWYGLQDAATMALQNRGYWYEYRGIGYLYRGEILYCRLLSGRYITYHNPRLTANEWGRLEISYQGWNTNPKNGPPQKWLRMKTFGGRLTENVVQATARDILTHAIVNLEKKGYEIVLHVHDEIVAEVPEGFGSVEEFETTMATLPAWANGWPLKASGGWRAKRYGK